MKEIRAVLIEQGIAVRAGARALRKSLLAILENRKDDISPHMAHYSVSPRQSLLHPLRGHGDPAATSTEFAIEDLHGTD